MSKNTKPSFPIKKPLSYWPINILKSVINLSLFKELVRLCGFHIANNIVGKNLAQIGPRTKILPTVLIREGQNITIGSDCYFNHNTILTGGHADGKLVIGNHVMTGPNVGMYVANHFYKDPQKTIDSQGYSENDIIIEDDVWIGANSIVTSGVRIGRGSVIGACSVVTKDIPPFSIAVGAPAKVIRKRDLN